LFQRISIEAKHRKSFIFVLYILVLICAIWLGTCLGSRPQLQLNAIAATLTSAQSVSVSRFIVLFIPLCITAWIVATGRVHLLLLLLFLKGVLFGLSVACICGAFPTSGWLLCLLLLFPELMGFFSYHWLWLRVFNGACKLDRDCLICSVSLLATFLIDWKVICPFTALLFKDL